MLISTNLSKLQVDFDFGTFGNLEAAKETAIPFSLYVAHYQRESGLKRSQFYASSDTEIFESMIKKQYVYYKYITLPNFYPHLTIF